MQVMSRHETDAIKDDGQEQYWHLTCCSCYRGKRKWREINDERERKVNETKQTEDGKIFKKKRRRRRRC